MQLCDQLEQQQNLSSEAHDQLVDTLLNVLTNSSDADEFQQNWQRISENFDLLFTTEYSIEQLKQTILQLAVMGKLVKQDFNDEPASELLKQIAEEKAKLVKEGKIKKSKPLPEITDEEKPFELPSGWEFVWKKEIFNFLNGYAFKSEWFDKNQCGMKLLRNINISHGYLNWSESVFLKEELIPDFRNFALEENDIVLTLDRPIISTGLKYAILRKEDLPCYLLQRVAKFQAFKDQTVYVKYLELWINSKFFISNIDQGRSNGVPHISTAQVEKILFALPPYSEQQRIVKKVTQLFSMIEMLQTLQGKLQRTKLNLADSFIANALCDSNDKSKFEVADNIVQFEKPIETMKQSSQKVTDQIDLFAEGSGEDYIKLLSLAAEITFQLHTEPTFGHLKLQKLIYLCQQLKHMDLAADFKQHAAGPYDPVMARYLDKELKDREWFSYDSKRDLKYKPLGKCNAHRSAFNRYFAKDVSEIYDLIGLFRTSKSDHIEIVATLFACWLRLLEKKQSVTEERLLKDFYEWSKEKKEFSKSEILNGYKWMKQNLVIPL